MATNQSTKAVPPSSPPPPPPQHYLIPLFPCFQLLDLAGPLDMLNLLSMTPGSGLHNLTLTFVASTLDPVPTKPIPPKSGEYIFDPDQISSADRDDKVQNRSFNQFIVPDFTFDEYLARLKHNDTIGNTNTNTNPNTNNEDKSKTLHPIDVLLIPGGLGTRLTRIYTSTKNEAPLRKSNVADLIDFVTKISSRINHSIITVCTGSDVLASTGLLNHRRATTNALRFEYVASRHRDVEWLRWRRWVRSVPDDGTAVISTSDAAVEGDSMTIKNIKFDKPIYTSAGISAGMDVMLSFIAETSSLQLARKAAMSLEYDWTEINEGQVDPLYSRPGWREHFGA